MTAPPRIFLAHASEDKEQVRDLYRQLQEAGCVPWLDECDLIPGQNWQREIESAIRRSDVFVACLSRKSVAKQGYVQREFRLALNAYAEKPAGSLYLVPLKLDDCEIPDLQISSLGIRFRDLHWLDYWKPNGWLQLTRAIEAATKVAVAHEESSSDTAGALTGVQDKKQGESGEQSAAINANKGKAQDRFVSQPVAALKAPSANLKRWLVLGVILVGLTIFGLFRATEDENVTIGCDPACETNASFALSVSYAGATHLSGVVELGVLVPETAALNSWTLTSPALRPPDPEEIKSGTGVKDFRSGDVFPFFRIRGNPMDFNAFRRLSGDVGVAVPGYRVFAFKLGEIDWRGALIPRRRTIQPITFSNFIGAQGFPPGTIFFAFLADSKSSHILDQTELNAIVVVR